MHDELVALLVAGAGSHPAARLDPLLYRTLVLAVEGVTRIVLEEGDEGRSVTDAMIERAHRVLRRFATSALAGDGAGVAPLPLQTQPPLSRARSGS